MSTSQPSDSDSSQKAPTQESDKKSLSQVIGGWLRKHYLSLINCLLAIYVFMPFLAPVFMKTGQPNMAEPIYKFYGIFCHQLAFRSFFLFGQQPVYPRELAGLEKWLSYEKVSGNDGEDLPAASAFRGNAKLGYKVALCQRDLAIYASLLAFGLIFGLTRHKIKPISWFVWIFLGLVPIGLDGFSQLLSQSGLPFLSWLPLRESTPVLRLLTGGLFGWFTGWFGVPSLEEMINPKPKRLLTVIGEENK